MDRPELILSIQEAYDDLLVLVHKLTEDQICQPGPEGSWSVKDILAHIAAHQWRLLDWIKELDQQGFTVIPQPYDAPENELALLNDRIFQENADRELMEILGDLERSTRQLLDSLKLIDDSLYFSPDHLRSGEPLWHAVAANSVDHYLDHSKEIRVRFKPLDGFQENQMGEKS